MGCMSRMGRILQPKFNPYSRLTEDEYNFTTRAIELDSSVRLLPSSVKEVAIRFQMFCLLLLISHRWIVFSEMV